MRRYFILFNLLLLLQWSSAGAQEFESPKITCPQNIAADPVKCKAYMRWLKTIPGYQSYFVADSEDANSIASSQNKRSGPVKNRQPLDYSKMQKLIKYGRRPQPAKPKTTPKEK